MGRRSSLGFTAVLIGGLLLTSMARAQERSAPPGAVVVRGVQVREVRVGAPPSSNHDDQHRGRHDGQRRSHHDDQRHDAQRPTPGIERPLPLPVISGPVPRPQPVASAPRHTSGRVRSTRSFYSFKPRFNAGFGVVVGYPVIYPYAYPYDPFSPSVPASYAPAAPVRNTYSNVEASADTVTAAAPLTSAIECDGGAACGGVSFDITPASAQVSVDGVLIGAVEEFDSTSAPLLLAPGDHYIEVRRPGYRTASFDVTIVSGEVTPYQGTLERLQLRRP